MRQHSGEIKGGAKALRGKAPLHLEGLWKTDSKSDALKFEAYVKSLSRQRKNALLLTDSAQTGFNVEKTQLPT